MANEFSTGVLNQLGGNAPLNSIFKDALLKIYTGATPASAGGYPAADSATTGQLAATITLEGATANTTHTIRITPAVGNQVGSTWAVTLNGATARFVDDGTASVAEICTGLTNAINALKGGSITTPACTFNIPAVYGLFTVTNNTTSIDIAASAAGVSFTYSTAITGGTGTTGTLTAAVTVAPAMGLRFEPYSDVALGVLEKLSTDNWSGSAVAAGLMTHARLVLASDDGTLDHAAPRLQMLVATSGTSGLVLSNATATIGENIPVSTFQVTIA